MNRKAIADPLLEAAHLNIPVSLESACAVIGGMDREKVSSGAGGYHPHREMVLFRRGV